MKNHEKNKNIENIENQKSMDFSTTSSEFEKLIH